MHAPSGSLVFLEHVPDRERADELARVVFQEMLAQQMFHLDPATPGYGRPDQGLTRAILPTSTRWNSSTSTSVTFFEWP